MSAKKQHPYHMIPMSPWPLLASFALFFIVLGAVFILNPPSGTAGLGKPILYLSVLALTVTLIGWFRDIIHEAKSEHNTIVHKGFRWGMILFIASEVMFFAAFFWAYFHAALIPTDASGNVWPPQSITPLEAWDLPYFNTLLLLLSGTTITWAHEAMIEGRIQEMKKLTAYTIFIGIFFLGVQMYEYSHATFGFTEGIYPSTFYMATGFHGFHVLMGVGMLIVCWFRANAGHFKQGDHFGFDAAAWYWHFVDVVWLFLFVSIYWWGS